MKKNIYYYSINSFISFKINKDYYKDSHYVWVTPFFNAKNNPPSSNPHEIFLNALKGILNNDFHCEYFHRNRTGILYGAKQKLLSNVISIKQFNEIKKMIESEKNFIFFKPIIFIIMSSRVKKKLKTVAPDEKANFVSEEWIVENLRGKDFEAIELERL